MRVYTKVVIDISSGRVVASDSHEHAGPVALCKGSDTTINSVDEKYNEGLLDLSRKEWGVAEQYANLFKHGVTYDPEGIEKGDYIDGEWVSADKLPGRTDEYSLPNKEWSQWNSRFNAYKNSGEIDVADGTSTVPSARDLERWKASNPEPERTVVNNAQLQERTLGDIRGYDPDAQVSEMELILQNQAAQAELLPLQTALYRTQIEADQRLVPAQTDLSLAQIESEKTLLPQRTGFESAAIADRMSTMEERAPVRAAFYESALNGADPNARADEAQAGVEHAFGNTQKGFERALFTSGTHAGSGDMIKALNQRSLAKATGISAARTLAKRTTEDDNFKKLKSATAMPVA